MAKKLGRPTKFKEEYCQTILDYFDIPLSSIVTEEKMSASGVIEEIKVLKPNFMPTFEGFARSLGIHTDTLQEWKKVNSNFSVSYNLCKGIQKQFLVSHGLTGGYNASFAKFIAVNCTDLVDQTHVKTENETTVKTYGLAFDLNEKPETNKANNEE